MDLGDIFGGAGDFIGDITGANKMADAIKILGIGLIAIAVVMVIK